MDWEKINETVERLRVPTGWIYKWQPDLMVMTANEPVAMYRPQLIFVPDRGPPLRLEETG